MIQAININFNKRSTLQNKGVCDAIAVSNSLMDESKKVEKKIANYLVIPNNFVLSLSLSLRAGLTNFLISFVRAQGSPCITMVNKGLLGVSFVVLYSYLKTKYIKSIINYF